MANLGYVPEHEPGTEVLFCPIQGLPIVRSQRVRTLPGFHLVSLGAGRQALALGHYEAFGKKFPCHDLEYLHTDDKVFTCAEDNKVFLNHMSMQYHKYIRHELEQRKAERKRLRERATERQARSVAHAKQLEKKAAQAKLKRPQTPQTPAVARQPAASLGKASPAVSPAVAAGGDLATNDPYLGESAAGAAAAAPPTVAADPYSTAEDPYLEPTAPAASSSVSAEATSSAAAPAETSAALRPAPAAVDRPRPADEEDLYGDVAGDSAKKPRTASTYASAIGSMLANDFDEED